jgi:hypothetical protein
MRTNFRLSLVFFTGALLAPLLAFPQAKDVVRDSQHNVSISPVPAVHSETLTLVRTRDYSVSLGTVDCPNCKDLTCASFGPSVAGAKITSVELCRRQTSLIRTVVTGSGPVMSSGKRLAIWMRTLSKPGLVRRLSVFSLGSRLLDVGTPTKV